MSKPEKIFFSLIIVIVLMTEGAGATNYYLSAVGNNTNSGTSSLLPWKTIAQLNTTVFVPGDSVFFRCGDTFVGTINVSQSGTNVNNIVFTSYGSGNRPVITGALAVTNWTMTGPATYGTIYQADFTLSPIQFFSNNREKLIARYPNDHQYLSFDSSQVGYLKDQSLLTIGAATVNNSKVCIHNRQWCWEKTGVASLVADKLTFNANISLSGLSKYSYFLYDNMLHLDTIGEWKYDGVNQKINYIVPVGQTPTLMTCEASVPSYSNGMEFSSNAKYIKIINLAFEKQSNAGIFINNSGNRYISIENCAFAHQYYYGVQDKGRYNTISNCSFRDVDGLGIYLVAPGKGSTVHHNVFRNIGEFRNSGFGQQYNLSAIHNSASDSSYIHHNDIDSAGYCGISTDAAYNLIERNVVRNAMLCNNDGAALKSWGPVAHHNTIQNNIIYNSNGNTEGCFNADFKTPAIYFDFFVNNCKIYNNTITNHTARGIFQNSANYNNALIGNVVYGTEYCIDLNGTQAQTIAINGMVIKHNTLFALTPTAYNIKQIDGINNYTVSQGYIDSNYCFQPYNASNIGLRMINNVTPTSYNFTTWQATGNDLKSKKSFVNWTLPTNNSTLFINASDIINTYTLNGLYLDLDSNSVCNSFTLQPYTSRVLINSMQACANSLNEKTMETQISIYPNPASDMFFVRLKNAGIKIDTVTLTDLTGKIVKTQNANSDTEKIYTGNLANGLYLLLIQDTQGNKATSKVIINH